MSLETVDHPSHYGGADDPYEVIKVLRAWWGLGVPFSVGNAVKYVARAGKKPGVPALEDLKKARWYLDEEISTRAHSEQDADAYPPCETREKVETEGNQLKVNVSRLVGRGTQLTARVAQLEAELEATRRAPAEFHRDLEAALVRERRRSHATARRSLSPSSAGFGSGSSRTTSTRATRTSSGGRSASATWTPRAPRAPPVTP